MRSAILALASCGLLLSAALFVSGCGRKSEPLPDTLADCKEDAARCRGDALAARWAGDVKAARRAAERARAVAAHADALLAGMASRQEADESACSETAVLASHAERLVKLTEEDLRHADMTGSLKARAYRAARKPAVTIVLKASASAARQADETGMEEMSEPLRTAASNAADLAEMLTDRAKLADGRTDWKGVASDLDAAAANPPSELNCMIAAALLLSGRTNLAMFEADLAGPVAGAGLQNAFVLHLLRGIIYSMNGLPQLGLEQTEKACAIAGDDPAVTAPPLLGTIHLFTAWLYLEQRDYVAADREIARAMQVWPNNELSVFLTGERLLADGKRIEAAESFEKSAKGTDLEWLAGPLAKRAGDIRDGKEGDEPLVLDVGFLRKVGVAYLVHTCGDRPEVRKLQSSLQTAEDFGRKLVEHLPGK